MPKKFNENEREYIIKRLKEEARKCMTVYGIKKSSVDELVKRVNIPKGTFYLFYKSKEELFFEVINELQEDIKKKLLQEIADISGNITVDIFTDLLILIYNEAYHSGLLNPLLNGEMEILMRRLPDDMIKGHQQEDNLNIEELFKFLSIKDSSKIKVYSGAFRGIFMTLLYRREIGEEIYDDVLRMLLRGLVVQMMEES